MLRFGYKTPLSPIGDWLLKILKILVLSKRKLVIRYVGVQVQTPSSCRPCPFCTYCHKVKHKRFYPAGWRESCEYRRYTPNEKREKVFHLLGVLERHGDELLKRYNITLTQLKRLHILKLYCNFIIDKNRGLQTKLNTKLNILLLKLNEKNKKFS